MPGQADRILILGGTAEAIKLAKELVDKGNAHVITSLAGRTQQPSLPVGSVRIGGFGGVAGLVAYLTSEHISHVYDATHPFARGISANAVEACRLTGIPLTILTRPVWQQQPGDNWIDVETLDEAAQALPKGARAFLALGRQYIDAFSNRNDCHFVVRMVDRPSEALPFTDPIIILGKAESDWEKEKSLLQTHAITHVVARNSGGAHSYGKIIAARELAIPVIMIGRRPSANKCDLHVSSKRQDTFEGDERDF